MKVTLVSLSPSEHSTQAGKIALTPELLAATGARYSRSNEGLEEIVARIDFANPDKSVDSIFKMVDYGHASIADMAPVAIFMDDISLYAAFYLWSIAPTAGGQESSTRYIKYSPEKLLEKSHLPKSLHTQYDRFLNDAFTHYSKALTFWENLGSTHPDLLKIPHSVLSDSSEAGVKKLARMKRNYAFDRARVFLPLAAKTNVMMINSARSWVEIVSKLASSPLAEFQLLASKLRDEINLVTPRLTKHSFAKDSSQKLFASQLAKNQSHLAKLEAPKNKAIDPDDGAFLQLFKTPHSLDLTSSIANRENRYSDTDLDVKLTGVHFGFAKIAMAELRDLNRHRTGQKYFSGLPNDFHCCLSVCPKEHIDELRQLKEFGIQSLEFAQELIRAGDSNYIYFTLLGHTYEFSHLTTLDKYIYEAELRTGVGAHYRYAWHMSNTLKELYRLEPSLQSVVKEGTGEPE